MSLYLLFLIIPVGYFMVFGIYVYIRHSVSKHHELKEGDKHYGKSLLWMVFKDLGYLFAMVVLIIPCLVFMPFINYELSRQEQEGREGLLSRLFLR